MSDVTEWIEAASRELNVTLNRASETTAKQVIERAMAAFVRGNPRVWWLALRAPHRSFDSTKYGLLDVLPGAPDRVWFIPDDGSETLPVYELSPADVERCRQNCPLFEHYVVDPSFRWIVAESDHDEFIVCGPE